jgi:NADH:ubiquinone oxidoreductase subunit F (NADH-binding)
MTDRLLASAAPDLGSHEARLGPVPWRGGPGLLIATVEDSGLLGRGGAGFPTWRKLAAVRSGRRPVVIANAAEGEPASAKDRVLLTRAPHLVLDGLQLAMEAVGATRGHLYAVSGAAAESGARALEERRAARVDRVPVELQVAPDTFTAGEESAAVSRVEGRRAVPKDRRRMVVEAGVSGRPTLVQNVETLAHLALLARYGAAWFRDLGTRDEPGTFLASVSGAVRAAGVYEAPYGVPLTSLLAQAGGAASPLQAILVGGYHGAWLPAHALAELAMSRAALGPWGAATGAGVVVALPVTACGLIESARIVNYLAGQAAGQCGPCINGLPAMASTLEALARGHRSPGLVAQVERLAVLVEGRGACSHPDGTVRLVRSTLRTFAEEAERHLAGRCGAVYANAS